MRPSRVLIPVFMLLGGLGALALWTGVAMLLTPTDVPTAAVGPLLIGAILLGIGTVVPIVLWRRAVLHQQRPAEPWAWREDWAAGRITGTTGSVAGAMWLFVLVWNGFTWPVAWLFFTERRDEPGISFVLLFPDVGVCSCWSRSAAHHRRGRTAAHR